MEQPKTMARRKELGSIASGLIGSFSSRNNDIDGYWGIGKLYRFAKINETDNIVIDLIKQEMTPQSTDFNSLITFYRTMLARRIPLTWIASATITVRFNQEYKAKYHYWTSNLGKPCMCECEIIDDNGRTYYAYTGTNCQPHDPSKESRSCRVNHHTPASPF
ncbi:MAG: phage terminase family protein [Psychrosphaera sp.]|nr:phage terminase family protein [Psychrosphaera sp.]